MYKKLKSLKYTHWSDERRMINANLIKRQCLTFSPDDGFYLSPYFINSALRLLNVYLQGYIDHRYIDQKKKNQQYECLANKIVSLSLSLITCWLNYFNIGMGVRSYLYIDKGSVHDSIAPLNLDLGISNQLCRVAIRKTIQS